MELDLLDLMRIVWRRRWLIAVLAFLAGLTSYIGSKLTTPVYEARSRLLVIIARSGALDLLNQFNGVTRNQVANYVEILKSQSLLRTVADTLDLGDDPHTLKELQDSMSVHPLADTDAIEIRVQHTDANNARDWANAFVECFRARNLRDNQEDARAARIFIEEQLQVIGERLARAEVEIASYQKETRVVSPAEEVKRSIDQLAAFEAKRAELDVAAIQAQARLKQIERWLSTEEQTLISAQILARNPVFERYREELSSLYAELAAALAQYTEKHPTVMALQARIDKLEEDLAGETEMIVQSKTESVNPIHQSELQQAAVLQAEIMALEAGRDAVDIEIHRLESRLASLPTKEMELARLMREKSSAEAVYTMLVTKKSEMEIAEHMRAADVHVIDPAYLPDKDKPIKPRTRLNVAVAIFLGLFAGCGLAFLLEYLDPALKTRDEAAAVLELPVFGIIPDDEAFHGHGHQRKGFLPRLRQMMKGITGRAGR